MTRGTAALVSEVWRTVSLRGVLRTVDQRSLRRHPAAEFDAAYYSHDTDLAAVSRSAQ
jgi:hypothetical protein